MKRNQMLSYLEDGSWIRVLILQTSKTSLTKRLNSGGGEITTSKKVLSAHQKVQTKKVKPSSLNLNEVEGQLSDLIKHKYLMSDRIIRLQVSMVIGKSLLPDKTSIV